MACQINTRRKKPVEYKNIFTFLVYISSFEAVSPRTGTVRDTPFLGVATPRAGRLCQRKSLYYVEGINCVLVGEIPVIDPSYGI